MSALTVDEILDTLRGEFPDEPEYQWSRSDTEFTMPNQREINRIMNEAMDRVGERQYRRMVQGEWIDQREERQRPDVRQMVFGDAVLRQVFEWLRGLASGV